MGPNQNMSQKLFLLKKNTMLERIRSQDDLLHVLNLKDSERYNGCSLCQRCLNDELQSYEGLAGSGYTGHEVKCSSPFCIA